jgi:hypothetical protein
LRRFALLLPIVLLLAAAVPFFADTIQQAAKPSPALNVTKDVAVPTRDGAVLCADVVLPNASGRFPTLVYRTPYGKQFVLKEGSPTAISPRIKTKATTATTPLNGPRANRGQTGTSARSGSPIPAPCNGSQPLKILRISKPWSLP